MGLTSRITLQQRGAGVDALGEASGAWTDIATVWGEIRHLNGMETLKAGAEKSVVRASIKVNRRAGITNGMRALHGTTAYDVDAVLPDEVDRRFMFLTCTLIQ